MSVEQREVITADHPHRQRVLHESGPAVRCQLSRCAVQPADALGGELLADVVELAVDAGEPPAQPPRHLLIGRQCGRRATVATQCRLGDGDDQSQLIRRHGDPPDRGVTLLRRLGGCRRERRIGHVDREFIRGRAGGEPHHRVVEHQGQHGTGRDECLESPGYVGDRGGQLAADVRQQPDALLLRDAEELAVEVAVAVVEHEIGIAPDRERLPVDGRGLAAEVDVGSHGCVISRWTERRRSRAP